MKGSGFHRVFSALVFLGVVSAAAADGVSLYRIGIDPDGAPVTEAVDPGGYTRDFGAIVGSVSDSALPVLNRAGPKSAWKLQTLVVGVGVGAEFGIGPILKIKASPRLRMVFSPGEDPALP
jgi:hypothetical protein